MDRGLIAVLGLRHPFTGALYEKDPDGHIKVTGADGNWGLFQVNGQWIRGALRQCDPQMCNWVGGPQFGNHRLTPSSS
jgi:hypothetical protein